MRLDGARCASIRLCDSPRWSSGLQGFTPQVVGTRNTRPTCARASRLRRVGDSGSHQFSRRGTHLALSGLLLRVDPGRSGRRSASTLDASRLPALGARHASPAPLAPFSIRIAAQPTVARCAKSENGSNAPKNEVCTIWPTWKIKATSSPSLP